MVFIRKKCVISNFHDIPWQFTLFHMCRLVVFSMFSKVHHVDLSGNKPNSCVYHRVSAYFPPAVQIIQTLRPSTGLQEHHFLDWWKKSDKVLLSTWAVDIAWRGIMLSFVFFFLWVRLHESKETCEGCWKWESTFSDLVSNILCAGCMVMFWEVVIPPVVSSHLDDSPYLTRVCHVETMAIATRAKEKTHIRPRVGEPKYTKWHPWNRPQLQQVTWMANCMMPWLIYTTRWQFLIMFCIAEHLFCGTPCWIWQTEKDRTRCKHANSFFF